MYLLFIKADNFVIIPKAYGVRKSTMFIWMTPHITKPSEPDFALQVRLLLLCVYVSNQGFPMVTKLYWCKCGVNEHRADRKVVAAQGLFGFLFYAPVANEKNFYHKMSSLSWGYYTTSAERMQLIGDRHPVP